MRKTVDISFLPRYNTPILWRKKGSRQIFKTGFQPSALRKKTTNRYYFEGESVL